ncbi:MAG: branched-chain amino acid ABC transporter permease [Chloroflexi bacterium]|nr:branched-chain amino acid ABC transporter permease [Chloroflexota bacterium]
MDTFLQLVVTGLAVGATYGLIALGFVLIYKASGVLNLAQGELMMFGAYICFVFSVQANIPFYAAVALTLPVALLIGAVIERFFLRYMIGQPLISVIMMTIGLMILMRGIATWIWGTEPKVYPQVFPQESMSIGSVNISYEYLWAAGLSIFFVLIYIIFFRFTKSGLVMRATSDDEHAALSIGISIKKVLSQSWAIAALTAAVGGIIIGALVGLDTTSFPQYGLKVLPVVLLGGLDSIPGAIIGGILIGLTENLVPEYLGFLGGGMEELAPYILVLIVLIVRPHGLFGLKRIERI